MLQLHIPLFDQGLFAGVVLGEFSVDGLLRYGVPSEVQARYAVSLLDAKGRVIAGTYHQPEGQRHPPAALDRAHQRIRSAGVAGGQRRWCCAPRPTALRRA
jgi:hypothetical protein